MLEFTPDGYLDIDHYYEETPFVLPESFELLDDDIMAMSQKQEIHLPFIPF